MSPTPDETSTPEREKRDAAWSSVVAAVFLTGMKTVVGILTGSIGILAEAAHSGLDLVAAGATVLAVSLSAHPPDEDHTYGHGKFENLSALFQTLLLVATCAWIVWEAGERLFFAPVAVEASPWAFAVMLASIVVDYSRSRMLMRMARKHHSQALEADALHFSTDIWSAAVVILGLALVKASHAWGLVWMEKADAVAALGVSGIVVYITFGLGHRTLDALTDAVSPRLLDAVTRAARVPGVVQVMRTRIRHSGSKAFADVVLTVDRGMSLEASHDVASGVEAAIQSLIPGADVMVHVEPAEAESQPGAGAKDETGDHRRPDDRS
jgi:cation diffusion facilitator family transporter